ncbi:MAG: hypothetical protein OXU42_09830 [Deltaproteobacteria bacterium]|nr:hypothetical protein [Deltaproteobacteria bacterium]
MAGSPRCTILALVFESRNRSSPRFALLRGAPGLFVGASAHAQKPTLIALEVKVTVGRVAGMGGKKLTDQVSVRRLQ